ncbi:ANKRD39 [Symbiodinium sp. CCMP2456]|nr:ANKRD39 [Symbiodinium sp. CCMP2456]
MKRARDDVLHVYNAVSGEEWATVSTDEFPTVRSLKQHLEGLCGVPRFRQRLLLGETTLQDDAMLGSGDLRLVLQAFAKTSKRQANELASSVEQGSIQRVEEILQRPQDPDLTDQDGRTPLYIAALKGNRSIVQLLLEARASVEKKCAIKTRRHGPSRARSALGAAALGGHEDVARLLLQAVANPNKVGGRVLGSA